VGAGLAGVLGDASWECFLNGLRLPRALRGCGADWGWFCLGRL